MKATIVLQLISLFTFIGAAVFHIAGQKKWHLLVALILLGFSEVVACSLLFIRPFHDNLVWLFYILTTLPQWWMMLGHYRNINFKNN